MSNRYSLTGYDAASAVEQAARAACIVSVPDRSGALFECISSANPKYPGTYIEDVWFSVLSDASYWNATRIRGIVNGYGSYIGLFAGNTAMPPFTVKTTGDTQGVTVATGIDNSWTFKGYGACLDVAAYFTYLVCRADQLGDATVYAAWKSACLAALASVPRTAAGSVYIDPSLLSSGFSRVTVGSMYQDSQTGLSGADALVTTQTAWAYRLLRESASAHGDSATVSACDSNIISLRAGLSADLRITVGTYAGFYKASTSETVPHTVATALALAADLCLNSTERTATANALVAAYTGAAPFSSNVITAHGGVRLIVAPNFWSACDAPEGDYRNGGYETLWAGYIIDALEAAGRSDLAAQLAGESLYEIGVVQASSGPWEWQEPDGSAGVSPPYYDSAVRFPSSATVLALPIVLFASSVSPAPQVDDHASPTADNPIVITGSIANRYLRTATADAYVDATVTNTKTATADAAVRVTGTKTATADAAVSVRGTKTATADAAVKATQTRTATATAAVRTTATRTAAGDAAVKVTGSRTATGDAAVRLTQAKTAAADGVVRALGVVRTATADAYVQLPGSTTWERTATADAAVLTTLSRTATAAAAVAATSTRTATASAYVASGSDELDRLTAENAKLKRIISLYGTPFP